MTNDNAVHTEEYKGFTIKILTDDNPDSPRNWDNAGRMVTWHNHYNLGDEQPKLNPGDWIKDFCVKNCDVIDSIWDLYNNGELTEQAAWLIVKQKYIFLPLFLYDHSGITISTSSFNDRWDSGQIGWIYISKKDAIKEWGKKLFTKTVEKKTVEYLQAEVTDYDNYLTGNVYGYIIENSNGETADSCWGFYPGGDDKMGYEYCLTEAKSYVDYEVNEAEQKKNEAARIPLAEIAYSE